MLGHTTDSVRGSILYNRNIYTYRGEYGYFYERYSGTYYLKTRFYDSQVGRFISPDDTDYLGVTGTVLSYNLYCYCENNGVNAHDSDGTWVQFVIGAVVCGLLNVVFYFVDCIISKVKIEFWRCMANFGVGAVNGMLAATGAGMVWQIIGGITCSIASLLLTTSVPTQEDFIIAILCGLLSGVLGGTLSNGANKHINKLIKLLGKNIGKNLFKTGFGKTLLNGVTYVFKNSRKLIKQFIIDYIKPNLTISIGGRLASYLGKI